MPTPLTRTFRHGLSSGDGNQERVIDSNLPSGIGQRRQFEPGTGTGYGTGLGYSTGLSRSSGQAPAAAPAAQLASAPASAVRRVPPAQPAPTQGGASAGGTITRNGLTTAYAPTPADGSNKGGTMTRAGATTIVPPSPRAIRTQMTPALPANQPAALQPALNSPGAPVTSPTTSAAPQTESNNPLTGDGNAQPADTTDAVDPGSALGLNRRGTTVPKGTDAVDGNVGGSGLYARKFGNPKSASIYGAYVKKLFPGVT